MATSNIFDRDKHLYKSDDFEEIIKGTIRFFNSTPVHKLPPPEEFTGTGVYALYYIGRNPYYRVLYKLNRIEFKQPIYVGKASLRDGGKQETPQRTKTCMNYTEG